MINPKFRDEEYFGKEQHDEEDYYDSYESATYNPSYEAGIHSATKRWVEYADRAYDLIND